MANAETDRRIDHTYLRDVGGTFFSIKLIDKNLCGSWLNNKKYDNEIICH